MGIKEDVLALADDVESTIGGCYGCLLDKRGLCKADSDFDCNDEVCKFVAHRLRAIVVRDAKDDTTVSAYDLLPEDEREAIAWVREHGGLDEVEKRLMPEGMEWLKVDGEPVDFKTFYGPSLGVLEAVSIYNNGACEVMSHDGIVENATEIHVFKPKVVDADGVEIRVGDVLYSVETGDYVIVDSIEPGNPWFATTDGALQHCAKFTHRDPVIAADGKPLREGETVYDVEDEKGYPHIVTSTELDGFGHVKTMCEEPIPASVSIHPNRLTHERPDSWERLEEEARQLDIDLNDTTDDYPRMSFCRDLVRRARKLAERGE